MSKFADFSRRVVRDMSAQGVRFQRRADGAVVVWFKEHPREQPGLYRRIGIIPANEWASVVSTMCVESETGFTFGLALQLHNGGCAYDSDAHQHESAE